MSLSLQSRRMGQFALGIRSLLIKAAIFVIMAALLAWALGGTLFPRPETADFNSQSVAFNGEKWFWRLLVGGRNDGEVRWNLMRQKDNAKPEAFAETAYTQVAGPVVASGVLYFAGCESNAAATWKIERVDPSGRTTALILPDRLAVEQQLARVAAGLSLQNAETIAGERGRVLDPSRDSADE